MRMRLVTLGLWAALTGWSCATAHPVPIRAAEHNDFCVRYTAQNELDKAQARCELALEFAPQWADPWNNMGLIELKRGNLDKAKDDFVKAIHLNQDHASAHNNLGYVFLKEHSLEKARDQFERALQVNPDYPDARYNLALTYLQMKDLVAARKTYQKLIESNPNIPDAHDDLCAIDIDEGKNDDAIEECLAAIRLAPRFAIAYFNLGDAYLKTGKFCEAQEAFADCIRNDGTNAACRNNVAIATRKCALLNAAENEAPTQPASNAAGEPIPDDANSLYQSGMAQLSSGLLNEARRSFNRCLRKNPQFALCSYQLYKLDLSVQNTEAATQDCKQVLENSADALAREREECQRFLANGGP